MPIHPDDTVVQSSGCLSSEIDGEVVVMSFERGLYLSLDPIGSDIWRRLATPHVVRVLCQSLHTEYDASPETIEADVLALLDTLAEANTINVSSPEPA